MVVKWLLIAVLSFFFSIGLYAQDQLGQLNVYKKFPKQGEKEQILALMQNPQQNKQVVDTSFFSLSTYETIKNWEQILNSAKKSNQIPDEISGIEVAGEMLINSKKHFFVVSQGKQVIDLTGGVLYLVSEIDKPLLQKILCQVKHYNCPFKR